MKIVNVIGGLGNQMFQYAFAIALKYTFPEEDIKLNISCFNGYPLHNGYELDKIFKEEFPIASVSDLLRSAYPWNHYRLWQIGKKIMPNKKTMLFDKDISSNTEIHDLKNKTYFDGYWQMPHFIEKYRDKIIESLKEPDFADDYNKKALEFIKTDKTAFIHIRRGDYIGHKIFGGICTLRYFETGINILRKKHGFNRFIIFSNDIDWCITNLSNFLEGCETCFADWNINEKSYLDLYLMKECKGALISNSSFSWWGAWLSKVEIVLCPEKWTNIEGRHDDIYPSGWIKITI